LTRHLSPNHLLSHSSNLRFYKQFRLTPRPVLAREYLGTVLATGETADVRKSESRGSLGLKKGE